jgi:hypothetical protein
MQIKGFKPQKAFNTFQTQYNGELEDEFVQFQSQTSGLLKLCVEEISLYLDSLSKADSLDSCLAEEDDLFNDEDDLGTSARDALEDTLKSIFLAKELIKNDHSSRTLDEKLTELLECFGVKKIELEGVDDSKLEKFTSLLDIAKNLDFKLSNDEIVQTLTNHFDLFYYFVEILKDYKRTNNSLPFNNDSSQYEAIKELASQNYNPKEFEEFSSMLPQVLDAKFFESKDLMSLFREQLFITFHSCFQLILDQIQNMDLGLIEKSIEKYGSSSDTYVFDRIPKLFSLIDKKCTVEAQKQEFFGMLNQLILKTIENHKDFFGFHKQIEKIHKKLSKEESDIIRYFNSLS